MPTEYDYERECREIDENMEKQTDKQLEEIIKKIEELKEQINKLEKTNETK